MASPDDDFSLLNHDGNAPPSNPALAHDAAFCSQPDPDDPSSFHDGSDPTKSRAGPSIEKRKDRDELSDGGTTPYPHKRSRLSSAAAASSGGESRKDREEWSDAAIACLLDAFIEKYTQLNRGNLRGRDWEEVAAAVSERCEKQRKSVDQCKNKVDNLKKRYKLEKHRVSNGSGGGGGGGTGSHWPWYKKMEVIVGNSLPSSKAVSEDDKVVVGSPNSVRQSKRYAFVVGLLILA